MGRDSDRGRERGSGKWARRWSEVDGMGERGYRERGKEYEREVERGRRREGGGEAEK